MMSKNVKGICPLDMIVYKSTEGTHSCKVDFNMAESDVHGTEKSMVVKGILPDELEGGETLSTLSLVCLPDITNVRLEILLSRVPKITSLSLCKLLNIDDDGLVTAVNEVPKLRTLHIGHTEKITDKGLRRVARSLQYLDSLRLWYMPNITDVGLYRAIKACPSLITLFLWQIPLLSTDGLVKLLNTAKLLRDITLRDLPQIDGDGVVSALSLKDSYIRKLVLWDLSEFYDIHLLRTLSNCTTLAELQLKDLDGVSGIGIVQAISQSEHSESILSLTLEYLRDVNDKELESILRALPHLRSLTLICLPSVNRMKTSLISSTPYLEELRLESFPSIGIKTIRKILNARTKKSLTKLSIYAMDNISKRELISTQKAFPKIQIMF